MSNAQSLFRLLAPYLANRAFIHAGAVFVAMLYGSAMPLVFCFASMSFFVCYWVEKYFLLKVCAWPVAYSSTLATFISDVLPYAALLHLVFGIWAFSYIATPQSPLVNDGIKSVLQFVCDSLNPVWKNTNQLSSSQMAARFAQSDCFHLIIFLIVCLIVLVLFNTINEMVWFGKSMARLVKAGRNQFNRHSSKRVVPIKSGKTLDHTLSEEDRPSINTSAARAIAAIYGDGEDGDSGPASPRNAAPKLRPGRKLNGAPDFDNAIRSKLLIGANSYLIEDAPLYVDAFKEEQEIKDEETQQLEGKLKDLKGKRTLLPQVTRHRRALRERAEKLASNDVSKPELRAILEQGNQVPRDVPEDQKAPKKASRQLIIANVDQLRNDDEGSPQSGGGWTSKPSAAALKAPAVIRVQDETREAIQPVRKLSQQQLQQQQEALYNEPDLGEISPIRGPSSLGGEREWDQPAAATMSGQEPENAIARGNEAKLDADFIAYTKEANEIFGRL
jgi:hypothetical protein